MPYYFFNTSIRKILHDRFYQNEERDNYSYRSNFGSSQSHSILAASKKGGKRKKEKKKKTREIKFPRELEEVTDKKYETSSRPWLWESFRDFTEEGREKKRKEEEERDRGEREGRSRARFIERGAPLIRVIRDAYALIDSDRSVSGNQLLARSSLDVNHAFRSSADRINRYAFCGNVKIASARYEREPRWYFVYFLDWLTRE